MVALPTQAITIPFVCLLGFKGASTTEYYHSDVYSSAKGRWFRYDDLRVSCVSEIDAVGGSRQKNGYLFLYMPEQLCHQVMTETARDL